MTFVYWIHRKTHTDITSEGYIGVTNDYNRRSNDHFYLLENNRHENRHLTFAYKKYNDIEYTILLEAPEEYCYDVESILRPTKNIGWNIAEGGSKPPASFGVAPWNKGLNGSIPWNKGKTHSSDHIMIAHKRSQEAIIAKYGVSNINKLPEYRQQHSERMKKTRANTKSITNGKINRFLKIGDPMPNGFWFGKLRSEKQVQAAIRTLEKINANRKASA